MLPELIRPAGLAVTELIVPADNRVWVNDPVCAVASRYGIDRS